MLPVTYFFYCAKLEHEVSRICNHVMDLSTWTFMPTALRDRLRVFISLQGIENQFSMQNITEREKLHLMSSLRVNKQISINNKTPIDPRD